MKIHISYVCGRIFFFFLFLLSPSFGEMSSAGGWYLPGGKKIKRYLHKKHTLSILKKKKDNKIKNCSYCMFFIFNFFKSCKKKEDSCSQSYISPPKNRAKFFFFLEFPWVNESLLPEFQRNIHNTLVK